MEQCYNHVKRVTLAPNKETDQFQSVTYVNPVRKQITVRALRRIKDDALAEDLDRFYVDQGCVDVDIIIEQYDKYLSDLLDKHAPKSIYMW